MDEYVPNRTPDGQVVDVERWGWYSIGVNVVMTLINLAIARASGSLAVEAEMVHNVVDFLTAVGALIGLKLATRRSKLCPGQGASGGWAGRGTADRGQFLPGGRKGKGH